jgi:tetratricopeptide (TPR) repeat protein
MKIISAIRLLLLVPLCLSGCKSLDATEVEFQVRQPDPHQVAQVRDLEKQEVSGYEPGDPEKGVLDAYIQFNRNSVAEDRSGSDLEQDVTNIRVAARMCLEQGGQERLRKLITWLLGRFEQSLSDLVAASKTKEAAAALLSGSKPPEDIRAPFEQFIQLGGDFIPNAYNAGLIVPSRQGGIQLAEGGPFFIRLAFKVRWARILPESTQPLSWLLTDFESEWYDIWTVERSKTAQLPRKLQAIVRLKNRNPAYPDHTARGIVYYQHKDFQQSVRCFEQALKEHPEDPRVKSFLKAAERHL